MILSRLRDRAGGAPAGGGTGSSDYSRNTRRLALILLVALALVGVFQGITPDPFRHYFVDVVLTRSLIFGVAAASIVFLSAFGGMISLAQTLMYGVCAFTIGNAVTTGGSKGLNLGWNPWVGVVLGIGVTTALGFLMGLLASRSSGLYYLMITLAYGVIGYYFFVQVTVLSGFGGVNQVRAPDFIGEPTDATNPERLFYSSLVVAVVVYLLLRYVSRTPFGLALQGVRDDPVRMNSLGYNVAMHRTWAFTLAAFVASLGGVLYVWEQRAIAPTAINLGGILNLLVMAIIGGVLVLEGAWLGAFIFVALENYVRNVVFLNNFIEESRFRTLIGAIVLVLVLACPDGVVGLRKVRGALPLALVGAAVWGVVGGLQEGDRGAIAGVIVGAVAGIGAAGLVGWLAGHRDTARGVWSKLLSTGRVPARN
ncbi:MAG: branched-chain amino acid ABC transporter permease [bacterium]|nr:branched-chain amino acid ABC transporter permease [bacterium]